MDKKARWIKDGKYYALSVISAGIDMTLCFLRDIHGDQIAKNIAAHMECVWNQDGANDPFYAEKTVAAHD